MRRDRNRNSSYMYLDDSGKCGKGGRRDASAPLCLRVRIEMMNKLVYIHEREHPIEITFFLVKRSGAESMSMYQFCILHSLVTISSVYFQDYEDFEKTSHISY